MNPKIASRQAWQSYGIAIALIAAAAALRLWPLHALEARLAWLTFYPAVMAAALFGGFAAGLLGTMLSCLAVLFLLPAFVHHPWIADFADWLGLAVFVATCAMISAIAEAMRRARAREKQAAAERDRFFELSLDMMCISKSDGYFKRLNPAFTETLGWSVEEILARPFLDFVHPDDRAPTLGAVEKQVVAGEKILQFENRYQHKDGSWRVLSWKSVPQPGGFMYATARDITDIRRTSRALEAANKELAAFAYSVSHDLRQPLRGMTGFSQILIEDFGPLLPPQARDYLERVQRASVRMGQLIDDMLTLSRVSRDELRRAPVNLSALAAEVLDELCKGEPGRQVECAVAEGLEVTGDGRLLRILLDNLLGNAWKFTGHVAQTKIEFGAIPSNGGRAFLVRDNGAGFDMAYADKLFGAFQRLHDSHEFPGTGIGLAIAQRIVNRHGGRIWAEGSVGQGATFYFTV